MACCPDGKSYRRLNAIHLLLIGVSYDLILRNCGRGERCLRLWISRFNEQGIDGLTYRPRIGRPSKLTAAEIESEILPVVDDPALAGQLHWTTVKLSGWIRQEKSFDISYRTLVTRRMASLRLLFAPSSGQLQLKFFDNQGLYEPSV